MTAPARLPCVLAIGGLDPGGGAGLLADARAILAAGAFPCAVAAVLTVQSTSGLVATQDVAPARLASQARAVLAHQRVRAIKTGALGSLANLRAVAAIADAHPDIPLVVDPVLLPSRGKGRLLASSATNALIRSLLPRATLVTANVPEAEALLRVRITSLSEAHDAALALVRLGARAALVKGGHMSGRDAVDVLAVAGEGVTELRARRLKLAALHGGGCTLASLVAGRLATGASVGEAVRWAKRVHHRALGRAVDVGGDARVLLP